MRIFFNRSGTVFFFETSFIQTKEKSEWDIQVNLTRNPYIFLWTNLIVGRWVGIEINRKILKYWFGENQIWILCVREYSMSPTLTRGGDPGIQGRNKHDFRGSRLTRVESRAQWPPRCWPISPTLIAACYGFFLTGEESLFGEDRRGRERSSRTSDSRGWLTLVLFDPMSLGGQSYRTVYLFGSMYVWLYVCMYVCMYVYVCIDVQNSLIRTLILSHNLVSFRLY